MTGNPVARYLEALQSGDEPTMQQLIDDVPPSELHAFFRKVDAGAAAGDHALDTELLHSSFRNAGMGAADSLRLASIGGGQATAWLGELLQEEGDLHDVAQAIAAGNTAVSDDDIPAITRYLARLRDGRHDVRRLTDTTLELIADALRVPFAALRSMRDAADQAGAFPSSHGLAAARGMGDTQPELLAHPPAADDGVDQLFSGRQLP